jgi:hypothetical protein
MLITGIKYEQTFTQKSKDELALHGKNSGP